jgi:argininosuccinate lyase
LPFRDAHEVVAHAVKRALDEGKDLAELPLATLQGLHAAISDDVYAVLTPRGSLEARNTVGGTAPAQVRGQIARHHARLGAA